ncbi:hypothetical protein [Calothrix sp. NIES-2098]|uniref:hypothetical protein n=1 Tax=Calothrix sp. NIES-2098 TaxID=1954171 RepID=UPI000B5DF688|nr:hypothetical protein NIES2098_38090 [Calothrix sp. NIES-2098]
MSFRDLRRYETQKAAYDNYKAWQALSPDAKHAAFAAITDETKRAKPKRVNGYISPFNQSGTALRYIILPVLKKTQDGQGAGVGNALTTILDTYYIDDTETAPTGGGIEYKRFKAAKLSFTLRQTFAKKTSRITKRVYLKPDVDTYTGAFGQASGGQTYATVSALLITASQNWVDAAEAGTKRSYKLIPEGA